MKIILSGGGTLGPVTPLLAIATTYKKHDNMVEFLWIGTKYGPEKILVSDADMRFISIYSGKFRRYFSFKNVIDIFRICIGFFESYTILKKEKPNLLISAGGFVSVPLHFAAFILKIPTWIHQQDIVPGLANRLMAKTATKITVSLLESLKYFDAKKSILLGNPCRDLKVQNNKTACESFDIHNDSPVILAMGGGTGSVKLNTLILEAVPFLPKNYNIIHLIGVGNSDDEFKKIKKIFPNYHFYNFLKEEMFNAYSCADIVVSRAGFGALTELAKLHKPIILLPIANNQQEYNAKLLAKAGSAVVMNEITDTGIILSEKIKEMINNKQKSSLMGDNLNRVLKVASFEKIIKVIEEFIK